MLKCKALVKNRKKSDEARVISYAFQFEFEMFTFSKVTVSILLSFLEEPKHPHYKSL